MCKFDPQSFFKPFIPVMVDDCRGRRLLLERGLLVEYNAFLGMALDSKLEYSLDLTHEHECLGLNFWLFVWWTDRTKFMDSGPRALRFAGRFITL